MGIKQELGQMFWEAEGGHAFSEEFKVSAFNEEQMVRKSSLADQFFKISYKQFKEL